MSDVFFRVISASDEGLVLLDILETRHMDHHVQERST